MHAHGIPHYLQPSNPQGQGFDFQEMVGTEKSKNKPMKNKDADDRCKCNRTRRSK